LALLILRVPVDIDGQFLPQNDYADIYANTMPEMRAA